MRIFPHGRVRGSCLSLAAQTLAAGVLMRHLQPDARVVRLMNPWSQMTGGYVPVIGTHRVTQPPRNSECVWIPPKTWNRTRIVRYRATAAFCFLPRRSVFVQSAIGLVQKSGKRTKPPAPPAVRPVVACLSLCAECHRMLPIWSSVPYYDSQRQLSSLSVIENKRFP
jgi:hypothetical protein